MTGSASASSAPATKATCSSARSIPITSTSWPSPTSAPTAGTARSTATGIRRAPMRPGPVCLKVYQEREGWADEAAARKHIKVYENDYNELLDDHERRGRDHRRAAAHASSGGHRRHAQGEARADREADGARRGPVQGNVPRRRRSERRTPTETRSCWPSAISGTTAFCTTTRSSKFARASSATSITSAPSGIGRTCPGNDSWQPPLPGDRTRWSKS